MDNRQTEPGRFRQVVIPQFSIRWLLLVTTVFAGLFSIVGLGVRGNAWAAGVSIALGSVVVLLTVHVFFFAGVLSMARLLTMIGLVKREQDESAFSGGSNPFASSGATGEAPATTPKEA